MTLLAPLGFLALLSLIGLIIIYILKPKYEERKVSSSFIWQLSLKYQKNKMPLQKFRSSFLLILQILILLTAVFLLVKPHLVTSSDLGEKIIIIESSGAMMAKNNGKTRFDKAIEQVDKFIKDEEKVTIILAGTTASYLVRREDDAAIIEQSLNNARCSYGTSNIEEALDLVSLVQGEISKSNVTLFGCKKYETTENITVVDVSNNEWNVAILNVDPLFEQGYYQFNTTLASFNETKQVTVALKVNGYLVSSQFINLEKDEIVNVKLAAGKEVNSYSNATVIIEANDSLLYDNEFHLFGGDEDKLNVQLVSDNPRFIRTALSVYGNFKFTELKPSYESHVDNIKYEDYDLYIFDGYNPEEIPQDGALWIFDPLEDTVLADDSISFGKYSDLTTEDNQLEISQNVSNELREITLNLNPDSITVSKYTNIKQNELYDVLLTCNDEPVLLTRNINNLKVSIFSFDLAYSNLAMTIYMPILIGNLYNYSLPPILDEYVVDSGKTILINAKPGTTSMLIESSLVSLEYVTFPVMLNVGTPGIYSIEQTSITSKKTNTNFYVRIPENESNFSLVHEGLELLPLSGDIEVEEVTDSYSLIYIISGTMILLLFIEWAVQSREQY